MIQHPEQLIQRHLRRRLASGVLRCGQRLSEISLAREFGVSRTPVRHAIRRLQAEGLLEQVAKSGTFVRRPTRRELREVTQIRLALEPVAARAAAGRISGEELARLRAICQRMRRVFRGLRRRRAVEFDQQSLYRTGRLDYAFHQVLWRAAGNRRLSRVLRSMKIGSMMVDPSHNGRFATAADMVRYLAQTLREHWQVYRAIRAGNGARAARLLAHFIREPGDFSGMKAQPQLPRRRQERSPKSTTGKSPE